MNLKVNTRDIQEDLGIVYLLEMYMEDKILVKIGITSRCNIADRVLEILGSIFTKYREFPYIRPKRFKKTNDIFKKETILHQYFNDRRYETLHKFGGCTEVFDIPLDEAVEIYEKVIEGATLDDLSAEMGG